MVLTRHFQGVNGLLRALRGRRERPGPFGAVQRALSNGLERCGLGLSGAKHYCAQTVGKAFACLALFRQIELAMTMLPLSLMNNAEMKVVPAPQTRAYRVH